MAKKLKLKYSKEKALAQLKRTNQTGFGPKATCVGDVDAGQITTKLRKVGLKQAWSKMCRKHCFSKQQCVMMVNGMGNGDENAILDR